MNAANLAAFRRGLRELGYSEGQHFTIVYRFAPEGAVDPFPALATELVRLPVDVIVARGVPATLAAQSATQAIPIVMPGNAEPLRIVGGLARPAGNVTGMSALTIELVPKLMELLRELIPSMARVGILTNMGNPVAVTRWQLAQKSGPALGLQPLLLDIRRQADVEPVFEQAVRQGVEGMITGVDHVARSNRDLIVGLAAKHRLPVVYPAREFVEAGGLLSYGADFADLYFRAAGFVDKIFKGAKPSDLPVEQPMSVELVVNQKTARALGLVIPQAVLLRANEVIE